MNLSWFIAKRYFFTLKKSNAINVISAISMAVFLIGAAVMIIILSFLNGLEGLVKQGNQSFDPDFRIVASKGKVFDPTIIKSQLLQMDEIETMSSVLEENIVVRYGEAQEIAKIKGVDEHYSKVTQLDSLIADGTNTLSKNGVSCGMFGVDLANRLNLYVANDLEVQVMVPRKGVAYNPLNPEQSLNTKYLLPSAILLINKDDDRDFLIAPIAFSRELLDYDKEITALEVKLSANVNVKKAEANLEKLLGEQYDVLNRYEQNETAYQVFKTEKWMTFAILSLIVLVAAFNAIGALTMLVLEKQKDLHILSGMGLTENKIRGIFMKEGMMLSTFGGLLGLLLGLGFCLVQDRIGIVRLDGSFIEYFPVAVKSADVMAVLAVIVLMGVIASLYPSILAAKLSKNLDR
jgi:ABC-type lipoprotein release transport system permease subunit